ncbi:MAG: DEAD/DEAH box helicase, partial [Acidimicrobiales bacterium]
MARPAPPARLRRRFVASLGFPLDPFQEEALDALDRGESVLVSAPTGAGKTVVGEYAVARALEAGGRAFYTTPLKALSNQKYGDLGRRHGLEAVGLLTGDNAVNGEAGVVVMTTEVLRNMIYAASPALDRLTCVVLDEVHYLSDPYRGAVWEEVIIHAPRRVTLVCLSATVSNAAELAGWIAGVRGPTTAVVEDRRPVELRHLYAVAEQQSSRLHLLPTLAGPRPNPKGASFDSRRLGGPGPGAGGSRGRPRPASPRRGAMVGRLEREGMLPAIYFVFSRAGCDDAVRQCLRDGLALTSPAEREGIRAVVAARVGGLARADLAVLGYRDFLAGLEAGVGAHHAGLIPPFKEAVEACFEAALVKVVFATETLSLGINMPARTVAIERFDKFGAAGRATLTSGEYAQLTGRAGRRGLDRVGHAVVLWSPETSFAQAARVALAPPPDLRSSFRPTYNLAVNLVDRYDRATALS